MKSGKHEDPGRFDSIPASLSVFIASCFPVEKSYITFL
jgi:hypothetical protein